MCEGYLPGNSGDAEGPAPCVLVSENRYEYIVAYFAVVCCGGVIAPVDPKLPEGEVAGLIQRAGAGAVFFSPKHKPAVEAALGGEDNPARLVPMDEVQPLIAEGERLIRSGERGYADAVIDARSMCALLFTSGTTGAAKGVMLSHAGLVANVAGMSAFVDARGMTALSVLPMHHTLEFTCDILAGMYQGCTIAICEGLRYILRDLIASGAQVVVGVPLVFEKMHRNIFKTAERAGRYELLRGMVNLSKLSGGSALSRVMFRSVRKALGGKVKLFLVGGAPIDPGIISDFNAMGIRMIQGYGLTENSPIISLGKNRRSKDASVGLPLPGSFVQIDGAGPDGVGEIIVAGPSVMLGYYRDEAATKQAMPDGRLRTGDLGRFDEDGFLYIAGRAKNVIVLSNGENVYPEEVEHYLLKSPFIAEALVSGEASGKATVFAEIFPDIGAVTRAFGEVDEAGLEKVIGREVDKANAAMPPHMRVRRTALRETPFEKTTTKKILRNSHTREV
jgi:long-chain acyl-CoA synthetase